MGDVDTKYIQSLRAFKTSLGKAGDTIMVDGQLYTLEDPNATTALSPLISLTFDGTTPITKAIYTVPAGKKLIIIGLSIYLVKAIGVGGGPTINIGTNSSSFNNIITGASPTITDTLTEIFFPASEAPFNLPNIHIGQPGDILTLTSDGGYTGTASVIVDLIGYLINV